jgi:hypothetical protein
MFKKSMKSSLVIAALLTGAYGFVSHAAAATGDVCVAGEIVHLTAQQGAVPIPPICLPPRGTPICPAEKGSEIE